MIIKVFFKEIIKPDPESQMLHIFCHCGMLSLKIYMFHLEYHRGQEIMGPRIGSFKEEKKEHGSIKG